MVAVQEATPAALAWADLVIVGGPTHAHGMTSAQSRKGARDAAEKPDSALTLDPDAAGPGLRDWFKALGAAARTSAPPRSTPGSTRRRS